MSTKYGDAVREVVQGGRFKPSKVRLELTPAEMVRILRKKNELTQAQLAAFAGLTQATISSIENERVRLGVERAKSLARALRVHPGVLAFPGWDVDSEGAA